MATPCNDDDAASCPYRCVNGRVVGMHMGTRESCEYDCPHCVGVQYTPIEREATPEMMARAELAKAIGRAERRAGAVWKN